MDLRAINKHQFGVAKKYWAAATIGKLALFGLGLIGVLSEGPPTYLPESILFIAILSELLQMRSDGFKSTAESLLRKLDLCRSFGLVISITDKRDIIVTVPKRLRKVFDTDEETDGYFASTTVPGPRKALENLYESAWYNGRQAVIMAVIYSLMIVAFLTSAIAALIVSARLPASQAVTESVIKGVTAWLMLIVSVNMIKAAWSYFKMYQRCNNNINDALRLLDGDPSEADALRQWHEYQVARSASPLIPEWLWRILKDSLNDAWIAANAER